MLTLENIHDTVRGVKRGGVEIQTQNKLYPDKIEMFYGKTLEYGERFYSKLKCEARRMTVTINTLLCINLFSDCDLSILEN